MLLGAVLRSGPDHAKPADAVVLAQSEQVPSIAGVPLWRRSLDALNGAADDLFHAVFG